MLSLVNYGASDSEDNISDEEDIPVPSKVHQNGSKTETDLESSSTIKLPQPINQKKSNETIEEEDDDEFLQKKEVADIKPPIKQKVKITIPKLSDFDEEDEKADSSLKYPTASNRKIGLLNMLPKPTHGSVPIKIPQALPKKIEKKPQQPSTSASNTKDMKKIGLIPYALMDHSKIATDDSKKSKRKTQQDSDESDDEEDNKFFSFDTKDEELPKVNDDEIKAMIAKATSRMEERQKKAEQPDTMEYEEQDYSQQYQQQQQEQFDQEAMKALVGGSKAKRAKLDNIEIVEISDVDVLPDKDEWLRRNLTGETNFIPTGQIDEKGPSALAKRKHQISYLSMRAEKNMSELEAMWAANRQSNREGRSKYGF